MPPSNPVGVIDTTIVIHLFRKLPAAIQWVAQGIPPLYVTPISWLEVMVGAPGKAGQASCKSILSRFQMEYLTRADFDWAMSSLEKYRLSNGVTSNDCLIASVAHRLQLPVYTHNAKDMRVLLDRKLVKVPY